VKNSLSSRDPCVFVIILSYCRPTDLRECIESVRKQKLRRIKIVVVDNCPIPLDAPLDGADFYLRPKENLGWGRGNNVGIKKALQEGAEYILLLNDDAVLEESCVDLLIGVMEEDPKIGISGPVIYYYDRPNLIWHDGGALDKRSHLAIAVPLRGSTVKDAYVSGCCMMLSVAMLKQIGLLEDRWFMGREEDDINLRAERAGFRTVVVLAAKAWHKVQYRDPRISYRANYHNVLSSLLLIDKHFGKKGVFSFLVFGATLQAFGLRTKTAESASHRRHEINPNLLLYLRAFLAYMKYRHLYLYSRNDRETQH
jgi:GT2 family glycosyltransferase